MQKMSLLDKLKIREPEVSLEHIMNNSKAESGGPRDFNFVGYLVDHHLLKFSEASLKRTNIGYGEEYFLERYKKMSFESDRHFICRTTVQDELFKLGFASQSAVECGNLSILRESCCYDIAADDYSVLIDVGLTPARNYFRGLTDPRVKCFLLTAYFDDYMDDIIFSMFSRVNDNDFMEAVKEYEESFKVVRPSAGDPLNIDTCQP